MRKSFKKNKKNTPNHDPPPSSGRLLFHMTQKKFPFSIHPKKLPNPSPKTF